MRKKVMPGDLLFKSPLGWLFHGKVNERSGIGGQGINVEVFLGGQNANTQGIYWWLPNLSKRLYTQRTQRVKKKKFPQFMNLANAMIEIQSRDKKTKEMEIEYLRDFSYTPITLYFVYYY